MSRRTSTPSDDGDPPTDRKGSRERELARLLKAIEIPDCGCPLRKRPLCVSSGTPGGCEERQESGDCSCPYLPGEPCPHVLAIDAEEVLALLDRRAERLLAADMLRSSEQDDQAVETWGLLLLAVAPDHAEPGATPKPTKALLQEDRVARMRARFHAGEQLRHPDDDKVRRVGVQMGKGRRQLDLTIPDEDE